MCVCKCMCSSMLAFFLFFFSFPRKGFFVATFCMRSILFAGSNREKKSHRFSSLLLLNKKSPYALSFSFFFFTQLQERERDVSFSLSFSFALPLLLPESVRHVHVLHVYTRKKSLSFRPIISLLDIDLYHL